MKTVTNESYNLTCVSGYWNIKNKYNNKYEHWFENTLKINCPYIFFVDKYSIEIIKKYRENLPTYYIELDIENFTMYKYKDKIKTDNIHCPSIELNLIWNEKIFLIQKAFKINPFKSDYFCWIDAGISYYRDKVPPSIPFPNKEKLKHIPKDKFIYSKCPKETETYLTNYNLLNKGEYHLYKIITGTSYILYKNMIDKFVDIYKNYLKLIDKSEIWTDQVILSHIYLDNKELFHKLGENYGEIVSELY